MPARRSRNLVSRTALLRKIKSRIVEMQKDLDRLVAASERKDARRKRSEQSRTGRPSPHRSPRRK